MNLDKTQFYATVRGKLGRLSTSQVEGFEIILAALSGAPLAHAAYMLATPWHETDKTMQPVREAFRLSEGWRKTHLRYWPWYGRGYVQLTWEANYERADREAAAIGLIKPGELIEDPDTAMRPNVAAFVLRTGMDEGWFTGVKNSTFLPIHGTATREQYMHARTIINGHDKADLIEDYAQAFERALLDGDWA